MSAAPSAHRATGRRGTGAPTPGRQPAQPHRHATGRGAPADPQHPVVSAHRPAAAPQRGGHRERHSPDRATGPTSGGWNGGPHPRQPSGPRRRNRLASEWEQRLRVRALDQSPSALLPSATSCGGVGARRWWTRRWASHSPEYWSAIATPPTTITMAPSNGAGRTCCGTSTTCGPATSKLPRWPAGPLGGGSPATLRGSQSLLSSSGPATACRSTSTQSTLERQG